MALALRDPHVKEPRGGAFRWSDGPAGVVLINEFFGIPEPEPPEPEPDTGGLTRRFMQLRRGR